MTRHDWPRFDPNDENKLSTVIEGRDYSLWLGTEGAPFSRPIWLPSQDGTASFNGRWGNRVLHHARTVEEHD
ncbi:MAG TPA: hypothetical protein VFH31_08700 [Pyrinomonadaceae bacterium]|nr:hypothetical protein [Pyrinomonadaceae bacterium]